MNNVTYRVNLDLHERESQEIVNLIQGDTNYQIEIAFSEDGVPYNIPENSLVTLAAKKPDGTYLYNSCVIDTDRNLAVYTPPSVQTTAVVGTVRACAVLILYGSDMTEESPYAIAQAVNNSHVIPIRTGSLVEDIVNREIIIVDTDGEIYERNITNRYSYQSIGVDESVTISNGALIYPKGRIKGSPGFKIIVAKREYDSESILSSNEFEVLDSYIQTLRTNLGLKVDKVFDASENEVALFDGTGNIKRSGLPRSVLELNTNKADSETVVPYNDRDVKYPSVGWVDAHKVENTRKIAYLIQGDTNYQIDTAFSEDGHAYELPVSSLVAPVVK